LVPAFEEGRLAKSSISRSKSRHLWQEDKADEIAAAALADQKMEAFREAAFSKAGTTRTAWTTRGMTKAYGGSSLRPPSGFR